MPLPSSGPLSLANIQTEFGGSNPISLSEYYAGGGLVPAGTTGTFGAVPSSGTISIRNFYGTSNVVISISDQIVSSSTLGTATAVAGYRLNSSGIIESRVQSSYTNLGNWVTPTSQAANYEVFATLNFGSASGPFGSWVALSSSREWTCAAAIGNADSAGVFIEIRRIGTTTVLDSALIDLVADAT